MYIEHVVVLTTLATLSRTFFPPDTQLGFIAILLQMIEKGPESSISQWDAASQALL